MTGLALQIDDKWAVLDEDVSVSIEDNSPVWGDGNSFSLPFSLNIEANRHILGNSDQITGQSVYDVLDGRRAVLYTLGIPVYYGKIKMDDEVEIAEGYVDVTLVSGNLTFDEMIDGMNCQDVELMDEIVVGEGIDYFEGFFLNFGTWRTLYFPPELMHMKVDGVSTVNVTKPYPDAKYCNTRIAYQLPEVPDDEQRNSASKDNAKDESTYLQDKKIMDVKEGKFASYLVLDADRPLSGLCFFVLYFLDCLFAKLQLSFDSSNLSTMEDMNRLAFFSTRCSCTFKDSGVVYESTDDVRKIVPSFRTNKGEFWFNGNQYRKSGFHKCYYIADSKNFPDEDVSSVIESLRNGFGIRFLHDENNRSVKGVYLKDILSNQEIKQIHSVDIFEVSRIDNAIKGLTLKYSGDSDDTSYSYSDWANLNVSKHYNEIKSEVYAYNNTVYIDKKTGDAYRIKVNKEAKTSAELNPVLTEVAEFIPVEYGDCSKEDCIENIEIPFTPIKQNDVYKGEEEEQSFATFLDINMQYPSFVPYTEFSFFGLDPYHNFKYTYFSAQRSSDEGASHTFDFKQDSVRFENNNSLFDYESGLTLGIMRGPGREAGTEEFDENYDGENNIKYVTVAQDYTFHSDTLDNYGHPFDYNGKESGGVDTSGRFSLKLKAEKPINASLSELSLTYEEFYNAWKEWGVSDEDIKLAWDTLVADAEYYKKHGYYPIDEPYAQKRGLFDKFYTEYAYFVVNRKIVKMVCRMEMADVLNIDWTKRYKIGDYVGFINKYSYTVDSTGMSDVTLEMYYV